ncbi:hypothetical protein ACWGQT_07415 [Streptomyces yangpuensis]
MQHIARTPSGKIITCDGCGAPVEKVLDGMTHPTPKGLYAGTDVVYVVCAPLPGNTGQPCLELARLADEIHLRSCEACRRALGHGRLAKILAELTTTE